MLRAVRGKLYVMSAALCATATCHAPGATQRALRAMRYAEAMRFAPDTTRYALCVMNCALGVAEYRVLEDALPATRHALYATRYTLCATAISHALYTIRHALRATRYAFTLRAVRGI